MIKNIFLAMLGLIISINSSGAQEVGSSAAQDILYKENLMSRQDLDTALEVVASSQNSETDKVILSKVLERYYLYGFYPLKILNTPASLVLENFVYQHAKDNYLIAELLPLFNGYFDKLFHSQRSQDSIQDLVRTEKFKQIDYGSLDKIYKDTAFDKYYHHLMLPFQARHRTRELLGHFIKRIGQRLLSRNAIKSMYFTYLYLSEVSPNFRAEEEYLFYPARAGFAHAQYALAYALYYDYLRSRPEDQTEERREIIKCWVAKAAAQGMSEAQDTQVLLNEKGFSATVKFVEIPIP
ncbi:hypothetical protein [Candidatus Odyssella thessalonicensis]|uniref:hypothetical protein n=1 Tax=Candidatus Odyssella thessalonicensis TaxID=84647 RepID=UPI000225C15B|nr:hypothetical protein [Candidatus Odyssella thessalonicensis]